MSSVRACIGVVLPKSLSNIPQQPQLPNPRPWLIAQILLAIKPAISGRLRIAAILENMPRSRAIPRTTSIQGRISEIKKATAGVQKEPRRASMNSVCPGKAPSLSDSPGSLPIPATNSISPSNRQGTMTINILCRLVFNCGFGMPIRAIVTCPFPGLKRILHRLF